MVYQPGDRFATISDEGHARVWLVESDGMAHIVDWLEPKPLPDPGTTERNP